MKKIYILWNQTDYGYGYEFFGAYTTLAKAEKAFNDEMIKRYGTNDLDRLNIYWNNGDGTDSWQISDIEIKD